MEPLTKCPRSPTPAPWAGAFIAGVVVALLFAAMLRALGGSPPALRPAGELRPPAKLVAPLRL